MKFLLGATARMVYDALGTPDNWEVSEHTIKHVPSGVKFWTGNGRFFFNPYDPSSKVFNVVEKFILYPRCRRMVQKKLFLRMVRDVAGDTP